MKPGCKAFDPSAGGKGNYNIASGFAFCKNKGYDRCDSINYYNGKVNTDLGCGGSVNCLDEMQYIYRNVTEYIDKIVDVNVTEYRNKTIYYNVTEYIDKIVDVNVTEYRNKTIYYNVTEYVDKIVDVTEPTLVNETVYVDETTFVPYSVSKVVTLKSGQNISLDTVDSNLQGLKLNLMYVNALPKTISSESYCSNQNNYILYPDTSLAYLALGDCVLVRDLCLNLDKLNYNGSISCLELGSDNVNFMLGNGSKFAGPLNKSDKVMVYNRNFVDFVDIVDGNPYAYIALYGAINGKSTTYGFKGDVRNFISNPEMSVLFMQINDTNLLDSSAYTIIPDPDDNAVLNLTYRGVKAVVVKKPVVMPVLRNITKKVTIQVPVQVTKSEVITEAVNVIKQVKIKVPVQVTKSEVITEAVNVIKQVKIKVPVQVTKKIPIGTKVNCYYNPGKATPLMINCCKGGMEVQKPVEPNVPARKF